MSYNVKICVCGKPLFMIRTKAGRYMPAEADEELTIIDQDGEIRKGWRVHWGRCPDDKDFRDKKVHKDAQDAPDAPDAPHAPDPQAQLPLGAVCACGHLAGYHSIGQDEAGSCCTVQGCSCRTFVQISGDPEGGGP